MDQVDELPDDAPVQEIVQWFPGRGLAPLKAADLRGFVLLGIGAAACGALAIGALSIGAMAVGRLAIGRVRMRDVFIDRLTVGELNVLDR